MHATTGVHLVLRLNPLGVQSRCGYESLGIKVKFSLLYSAVLKGLISPMSIERHGLRGLTVETHCENNGMGVFP